MHFSVARNAIKSQDIMQAMVLFSFLMPLFFQLSGNIFIGTGFHFDAKGSLLLTPLPIACITCFIGIALLLRWENHYFGIDVIFLIFILSMFSVLITASSTDKAELAKFVLLIQFLVPMFGFVLGQLYIEPESPYLTLEAIILYVLVLVIPAQVTLTLIAGEGMLVPDVGLFSLYQHLQYLPIIFVGLYFFSIISLAKYRVFRRVIVFLAPWFGVYIAASLSLNTFIFAALLMLVTMVILLTSRQKVLASVLLLLVGSAFFFHYQTIQTAKMYLQNFEVRGHATNTESIVRDQEKVKLHTALYFDCKEMWAQLLASNIKKQLSYWSYYTEALMTSSETLLFGHENRPDRSKYPSAHNYYLDFAYHFGVLALLPIIYLIVVTIYRAGVITFSGQAKAQTKVLFIIMLFFILLDNSVKVGLKQPYPGMIMFFLWGRLLQILDQHRVRGAE